MQQILHYTHEICFSHVDDDGEQYYQPKFYINQRAFDLEPMEDVILVLENCGANWFRQGILHDMVYVDGKFEFAKHPTKQLCLYIRNYSEQAHIHVEKGTELSSLLNQSEILYKTVGIPVEFLRQPPVDDVIKEWKSNAEEGKPIDDEEIPEMYYVKIFKNYEKKN